MNRLTLLIIGCFLVLGALVVLWWLSPASHELQRTMGLAITETRPKDVALVLHGLFGLGLIFVGGFVLETVVGGLVGAVTGARKSSQEALGPLVAWGVGFYVFIALLIGFFGLAVVQGSSAFERFFDPAFLMVLLLWPYQLAAAAGLFGIPAAAFY